MSGGISLEHAIIIYTVIVARVFNEPYLSNANTKTWVQQALAAEKVVWRLHLGATTAAVNSGMGVSRIPQTPSPWMRRLVSPHSARS